MSTIRFLVACGSGIATSTIAAERLREICNDCEIDAAITKCHINEIPGLENEADVIIVTTRYSATNTMKPVISGIPLITGVDEEKVVQEIRTLIGK